MKYSVVIPHYNSGEQIRIAYESLLKQTYKLYEIIIVDDCSYDISILKDIELKHNSSVKLTVVYLNKNSGPSKARNVGVELSKMEYIAFLDSDDVWHPKKLEICNEFLEKFKLDFLYHIYSPLPLSYELNFNKAILKRKKRYDFALKNYIATPTVVIKRDKFIGFPEDLSYCEDYCCWLLTDNDYFYYIDLPLANGFKKPIGANGLSGNIFLMHKGFISALIYLKDKKKISLLFFFVAFMFEYLKFPLRYFR